MLRPGDGEDVESKCLVRDMRLVAPFPSGRCKAAGTHARCGVFVMPALPSPRAALLLVSMLVAACGGATRVAYDNADVAVLVMADRYLEAARKVRADPAPALGGDEVSLRGKICAPGQFLPC